MGGDGPGGSTSGEDARGVPQGRSGPLQVLMDAGPWLPLPPDGYGGLENVVTTLVGGLRARGVVVHLAACEGTTLEADHLVPGGRPAFEVLGKSYVHPVGRVVAHERRVVAYLREHPEIDIVHNHVEVVGPSLMDQADLPPTLHTLHWDPHRQMEAYSTFGDLRRVWANGVSASHAGRFPAGLDSRRVGHVYLGTPAPSVTPGGDPDGPALVMGRITPVKGQDVAARACKAAGIPLVLAGPVGPHPDPAALEAGEKDHADVGYYTDEVAPLLDDQRRWIGSVTGVDKDELYASSRCLLMPISWEEPGATVVVEALAAGLPVVALARGVLPELVEHGVTGFLTDDPDELPSLLERLPEIDRGACRRSWEQRFTPEAMAGGYLELYRKVLAQV